MIEASSKLDDILMDCIQAIEEKGWSIEDCLRRYPHLRQELKPMLEAAIRLKNVRSVQPSLRFKRETLSRMQLRLQASRRPLKSPLVQRRVSTESILPRARIQLKKKPTLQWVLPVLIGAFVFIAMLGGLTFVADAANPGDVLYQFDQTIEQVQIRLAPSAERRIRLYLNFASERIEEAFALVEKGKADQMTVALEGYEKNIHAAETILNEDIAGKEGYQQFVEFLDETLEIQTEKLQRLMVVAPATAQSSIQAAIMKISNVRFAMAMPPSEATATPHADETLISPVPSETRMPSPTVPPTTTPTAGGTLIPSPTPVPSSTSVPPTATASPPVAASRTPSPTYPPPTNTPVPTFTHTHTPSPSPTPTPSDTPIPGPDLIVSEYQWDSSLPPGSTVILDYLVRNIGITTAPGGYLVQLYVDDIPLPNIDPEIGVREGRLLLAGETDIDYFLWTTTCGVHSLYIVVDDANIVQEINETNNSSDDYTITVNCGTPTPP